MLVCFASQTSGLCSAFPFGSLPRILHTFICYVGVLRLAPFAQVSLFCQCVSPRKLRACAVLFSSAPSDLYAFILYLYFTVNFVWRISPCKLRVCVVLSRPSLEFVRFCFVPFGELMFRVFCLTWFPTTSRALVLNACFASQTMGLCSAFAFVQCYSLDAHFLFLSCLFSLFSLCVSRLLNVGFWSSVQCPTSSFEFERFGFCSFLI